MAIENKYGRVTTERGNIGEDEPVVVFRAQDILLPELMLWYKDRCRWKGSPQEHLDRITDTWRKIVDWQAAHPTITKVPD